MRTIRIPARSKFNVNHSAAGKAQRTFDGVVYDSKAEANYAALLALQQRSNLIAGWKRQPVITLAANGLPVCRMRLDFEVQHKDGTVELIEIKGFETAVYKLKLKLLKACYPGVRLTVVKAK